MKKMIMVFILIFSASLFGQNLSYNQLRRLTMGGGQNNPDVALLSAGGFVLCGRIWTSKISVLRFDENFNRVGNITDLNWTITASDIKARIGSFSDDSYILCYDYKKQTENGRDVFYQLFNTYGSKSGDEVRVNTYIQSDQKSPVIAILNDDKFVISWYSYDQDGSDAGIYAQCFNKSGSKFGNEFRVNSYTLLNQIHPIITSLNDGGFIICWQETRSGENQNIRAQRYDAECNRVGDDFMVNNESPCINEHPCVASLKNGGFVICWDSWNPDRNVYEIMVQRFEKNASKTGEQICVNKNFDSVQARHHLGPLENGGFVTSWISDVDGPKVIAQIFSSDGNKLGPEFLVSDDKSVDTDKSVSWDVPLVKSLKSDKFMIFWNWGGLVYKYYLNEPIDHQIVSFNLLGPVNDATLSSKKPTFIWSSASQVRICFSWELGYDLYLDKTPDFLDARIYTNLQDSTFSLPGSDSLQAGQTYFWKVLVKTFTGDSLWSSNTNAFFVSHNATEVEEEAELPTGYVLEQNYPNPFNPVTTVRYTLPGSGQVELALYDITGRRVMQLVNGMQSTGTHTVKIDGSDLASGVYVYTLKTGAFSESKKMVLVR